MNQARQKALVLVVDGLGDLPHVALEGRTPLEAAETPVLDRLAGRGRYGLVDPINPGQVPNTDSGVGMLLGLAPEEAGRLRRGPVEAAGTGRPLEPGDIAMRANFATIERRPEGLWLTDRRAGRITEGTEELAGVLDGMTLSSGLRVDYRPTDQHRGVLVLRGDRLDPSIGDTDPGDAGVPGYVPGCRAFKPAAEPVAAAVNEFLEKAHQRLCDHPVNRSRRAAGLPAASGVVTRGAGAGFAPVNRVRRAGVRAGVVAGCNTVLGLASLFGFTRLHRPEFTASIDTDLDAKVSTALSALRDHDLVYIHVKGPDLCAHDRRPLLKRAFIERLDGAISCLPELGTVVAVTSDHTTDSNLGSHTADPVPSLLFNPLDPGPGDPLVPFGERSCRGGTLPRQRSHEFLDRVLAAMGVTGA
jgi:2,3-bisphosphoglycerate-independent phosphoglycerate mutase